MSATPDHWFEVDENKHVAVATEEEPEENPFIIIERKGWLTHFVPAIHIYGPLLTLS